MTLHETIGQLPALRARRAIPPEKRRSQWKKTIGGGLLLVGGLFVPRLGYPWQVGLGFSAFGAWIMSQQLVLTFLQAIPQAIAAIAGALVKK